MINSSQRAKLRSFAAGINSIFQIGKGGLGPNLIADIKTGLEAHELIKITVLKTADFSAKDIIKTIARATGSEPVTAIGNKIVLYKRSTRNDIEHIVI